MIRCLSIHASYACANVGACCRAGWPIPVEQRLVVPLRAFGFHVDRSGLIAAAADGQCSLFEATAGRLCAIHRRAGPGLLPSVCRHFPRVVVRDPRGATITLSHFCPTAAAMLFSGLPLAIVEAPRPLSLDGAVEGLDATDVLPPLLTAGVLADWEGYSTWEEEAVRIFDAGAAPEAAVRGLEVATAGACTWKPGVESLTSAIRRAFRDAQTCDAEGYDWCGFQRAVNAFLAAHAFASWAAYDPGGVGGIPRAVRRALEMLVEETRSREPLTRASLVEAIRAADWRLRHLGSDKGQTPA